MTVRVEAPVKGYTGRVGTLSFQGGVADADPEKDRATLAYCRQAGYRAEDKPVSCPAAPAAVDSRDITEPVRFGAPLRDAAVDPHEGDNLAPVGAGEADPHGPDVRARRLPDEQDDTVQADDEATDEATDEASNSAKDEAKPAPRRRTRTR